MAARRLWPLLATVLQLPAAADGSAPLLGSGFMCIDSGAQAQPLHKDVHGHDRHAAVGELAAGGAARAVSVQLQLTDTEAGGAAGGAGLGALEVLPGSHRPDAANGRPERIRAAVADGTGVVPIAVPAGTVTLYSSRLWHSGGANPSERERRFRRRFCFLTVCEPEAPAPAGLIHTMDIEDVGAWKLCGEGLVRAE